jgi:hypothetical protein
MEKTRRIPNSNAGNFNIYTSIFFHADQDLGDKIEKISHKNLGSLSR